MTGKQTQRLKNDIYLHRIYEESCSCQARCTQSETFFCGMGTQKYEYGAVRFLMSTIRRSRNEFKF